MLSQKSLVSEIFVGKKRPEVCVGDQLVPAWGDSDLLANILGASISELVDPVSYRGNATQQYFEALRDIHLMMRENYLTAIYRIGRNIFPLIVASDNEPGLEGVGTSYTLYLEDGSAKRIAPTPPEYEMYKCLSHMPLGIFTIISPYFKSPTTPGWISPLKAFHAKVRVAQYALAENNFDAELKEYNQKMLGLVDQYISDSLAKKYVDVDSFLHFSQKIYPYIERSMSKAAQLQAHAAIPALLEWKEELGERWRDLYVVIPTVWPVAGHNPRRQIFEKIMEPDRIKTHIIMVEGAKTTDDALTTLGRIVGDRTVGRFVFGTQSAAARSMVCALSTPRDVMSDACQDALEQIDHTMPMVPVLSQPNIASVPLPYLAGSTEPNAHCPHPTKS